MPNKPSWRASLALWYVNGMINPTMGLLGIPISDFEQLDKLSQRASLVLWFLDSLINLVVGWIGYGLNGHKGCKLNLACGNHVKLEHIHEDKYWVAMHTCSSKLWICALVIYLNLNSWLWNVFSWMAMICKSALFNVFGNNHVKDLEWQLCKTFRSIVDIVAQR